MARIQQPIKYYGGKGTMHKEISKYFPDKSSYNVYLEAFGGAYSVGLYNSFETPIEIYNDLEQNVYSLYKVISDKELFQQFKEKCDVIYYCEDMRREFKKNLKQEDISIIDRAFWFFYVNRTSFSGVGGFISSNCVRRKMSKPISDMLSCIDKLPELHQRCSKIIVLNQDGIELIKKWNRENVFMYLDPPYEQSTRTEFRYKVDMDRETHVKFLNICIDSKAKILISGYDNELYDVLLKNGFSKIKFDVKTVDGKNNKKTKTETLWKNY